ncbi:MAG: hypothetical protein U0270_25500 [Labilithrix sp.]
MKRAPFVLAALGAACANLDGLAGGPPDGSSPTEAGTSIDAGPAIDGAGDAGAGDLAFSVAPREIGFSFACADAVSAPQTRDVVLTNESDLGVDFQVGVEQSGTTFSVVDGVDGGLVGHIDPRGSRTLTVRAAFQRGATNETATLHVRVGSNDEQVSLSAAADGPRVEVGTLVADFGFVRQGLASAPISLVLTNTGTKPVKYLGPKIPSTNFTFGPATALAPGTSTTVEVAMTQGSAGTPVSESAALTFAEPLCNTPPEISLKGQRVANDLIVSPGTVELGDVECTSTAPKNGTLVTISNYSANTVSYASDLTDTTHFAILDSTGTVVAASGATPGRKTITVQPKAPQGSWGDYNGKLNLTFTGTPTPNPTSATVNVHVRSFGASLGYAQGSLHFPRNDTRTATLINSGNAPVCVTYGFASTETVFTVEPDDTIPNGLFGVGVDVTFNSSDQKVHNAVLTVTPVPCAGTTSATPLCKPAPTLAIDGKR